jgi:hypothetical protein
MMSINKTQGYLIYCALRVFKHNEFNYISMRTSIKVYFVPVQTILTKAHYHHT